MKRVRLLRWSGNVLSPRTRPEAIQSPNYSFHRFVATTSIPLDSVSRIQQDVTIPNPLSEEVLTELPSPPVSASKTSAKLSALHARLSLPSRLSIETLARTLVDESADQSPRFNNKAFSVLGADLLSYYTSEYIIAQYPRLPLAVIFAAMYAYVGPKALTAVTREWGVDYAAVPGGEVDPGLLQFTRASPKQSQHVSTSSSSSQEQPDHIRKIEEVRWRRGVSSKTVYDDEFGEGPEFATNNSLSSSEEQNGITAERACTNFIRAVMGVVYLHAGRVAAKKFYRDHFMSRQLNMANLFQFRYPTRDLSKLCAREGFQSPVARILSETGRKSRHPVFVVGVFSGNDKLGEAAGASLDEARIRAAVAALKGWYLYSPLDFRLPSETEEAGAKPWTPIYVDCGDIVT